MNKIIPAIQSQLGVIEGAMTACVTRDTEDFLYTVGTDFCPSCGAKMTDNKGEIDK